MNDEKSTSRQLALAVLSGSQLLIVLDATIVNVALTSISTDLDLDPGDLQWVLTGYLLTFGGFLLLGGRLADRIGRRRMYVAGATGFGIGSLVAGLAESAAPLLVGRSLQGLAAAMLAPAALSLLMTVFPPGPDRDRALAVWGGVSAAGTAIGLMLGGLLTQALSWEWVFWINVPITAAAALAAPRLLPAGRVPPSGRFDLAGAVLVTLGLVALVFALVRFADAGWTSITAWSAAAAALLMLTAFALLQVRRTDPLLPTTLLRNRVLVTGNALGFIVSVAIYGLFYLLSLFLGGMLGYGPIAIGLAFLPMALAIALGSAAAARLLPRAGHRVLLFTSFALVTAALASLARVAPDSTYAGVVLPGLLLAGLGLGVAFVALTDVAVGSTDPSDSGVAAALFNAVQQVGGAVGLAVISAVLTTAAATPTAGWSAGFVVAAAVTAAGLALIPTLRSGRVDADGSREDRRTA
ncbi:MFS transporter [Pseudonocardia sp. TRM90224]|uniref:MFS transporter n=1 Tax=Pseudonocardia sp. TRM90224 TaxID=2812678 RepID=UPI001E397B9A|nr:MFS transporter [Pseudonocardia sp. TRM90224]